MLTKSEKDSVPCLQHDLFSKLTIIVNFSFALNLLLSFIWDTVSVPGLVVAEKVKKLKVTSVDWI